MTRAFFEAPARRTIYAELPEEETHEGDDVEFLLQSLYGTRDASANFQEVGKVLTKAGFKRGKYNHERVGIKAPVHGDNNSVGGEARDQHGGSRRRPRRRSTGDKGFEQDHQDGP